MIKRQHSWDELYPLWCLFDIMYYFLNDMTKATSIVSVEHLQSFSLTHLPLSLCHCLSLTWDSAAQSHLRANIKKVTGRQEEWWFQPRLSYSGSAASLWIEALEPQLALAPSEPGVSAVLGAAPCQAPASALSTPSPCIGWADLGRVYFKHVVIYGPQDPC